ncbi:MAG: hypothetical protein K2H64_02900 [Desulfovibrio sp.]|nr:hypothetical protein [Desulfovibrio sp.]
MITETVFSILGALIVIALLIKFHKSLNRAAKIAERAVDAWSKSMDNAITRWEKNISDRRERWMIEQGFTDENGNTDWLKYKHHMCKVEKLLEELRWK